VSESLSLPFEHCFAGSIFADIMKVQNCGKSSPVAKGGKKRARLPLAVADGESAKPDRVRLKGEAKKNFPIVGVGASAGGLEAFTQLLQNLPVDTGMAFVLVQHLDPGHESALAQILARTTLMPVSEVTHGMEVAPNRVYVIPPNASMIIAGGILRLQPRGKIAGAQRSIDFFFESLAHDQQERAIGVILSGTATDGTQGLEMVKAEGGFTFAQDDSAKYDSMPRSAAGAGCVDLVLPPAGIAKELAKIATHPLIVWHRHGPQDGETEPAGAGRSRLQGAESAFKKILLLLRQHRGVDFSLYKPNTIQRRITRRMVLNKLDGLDDYARFLMGNPPELDLLYSDVLICVTSFFRNPEAFEALKRRIFPELLRGRRQDEPVRVWTLGCSTGQEAYSIAIAFTEVCDKIPGAPKLQIFATDLNESALEKARHALYTASQVVDVSPGRLRRFFVEDRGGYRICKSLRDACVFARQNVLSDPPFSRMDLVSCRNVLIYVELGLQKRLLPNFHYALKPGGFLFLGASESIGAFTNLFTPVDKKQKIFSKKAGLVAPYHLPVSHGHPAEKKDVAAGRPLLMPYLPRVELNAQREADRVTVNQYAPPGVLINEELDVLQFRGQTGAFLEPSSGKASFNVLKMARPGLMLPLRAAINEAKKQAEPVWEKNVRFVEGARARFVNIQVIPLKNLPERCYLILFEDVTKAGPARGGAALAAPVAAHSVGRKPGPATRNEIRRIEEMERDLAAARDFAQSLQEQHESASAELQASHEEGQSANEELQSIIEELETSKEELESTNEELITVNEELAGRNAELNHLNSDLNNLQTSTKLPIVLLDRDLRIRRFSPQAEKQFNLIAADVGRPFGGVRHDLELPDLEAFIARVIADTREREREVLDKHGRWHLLHVRPYVNLDNKVDGAVLVLVDINAAKDAERSVIIARDFAEAIIRTARDPFVILNADLSIERANEAFYDTFKIPRAECVGRNIFELDHGHWNVPKLRELLEDILPRHSFFNNFEVAHNFENLGRRTMLLNARTLSPAPGQPARILLGIQDISELLDFQSRMRLSELRYRRLFEASQDGVLVIDPDTRKILDANPFIAGLLGYSREELLGKELFEIGLLKDEAASRMAFEELHREGFIRYEDLPLETKSGRRREVEFVSNLYDEGGTRTIQCNIRDVTGRKLVERELSEKARLLDLSNDAIIIRDVDGRIRYWNHGAETLYGWSSAEALGKLSHVLLQTEYSTPLEEITRELHRINHWTGELVHVSRDGRRITVLARKSLDRDSHGNPSSILQNITDITERIQIEQALRKSEKRYRNLFDSIDEGFCVIEMLFDGDGKPVDYRYLEVNPAFARQTGIEGALGKRMRDIVPDHEEYWFDVYGSVARTGKPVRFVSKAKELNRWFDVYAFRIGAPEDHKVAVIFSNITERMAAESALRDAQVLLADRASQLEKAVGERTRELTTTNKQLEALVYSIAHDLRAPLRSMQGFSVMLLEEAGQALTETGRDFARRISESAQLIDSLLMDLITYSGIARRHIELTSVDLKSITGFALSRLEKVIQERNALVEMTGPWPAVLGHEPTLVQVLINLAGNALKFVTPGVVPRVRFRTEERGEFIRVWVEDNGIGIEPDHQRQIFRLFTRLHNKQYPGTGIGLAIVEKGIEQLGGHVGVESAAGQGSRFWFELKKA
jgi:two-component system, chemotaxis family, CheB/CheR fusion protein